MEIDREMLKQALKNEASCNQIAKSRGKSHNTVRRHKKLAEEFGLTSEMIDAMSDSELKPILYPGKQNTKFVYPDCEKEVEYLDKGYSLQDSHARYVEEVGQPHAIGYSAYCERIGDYRGNQKTEFRHSHEPGQDLQIDYGGKRPIGRENGLKRKYELFVAAFPASHYLFAVCTRTQSTADTIEASIKALEFYGGVPAQIVSDNLKAVVISRANGRIVINKQYLAFADHYKTMIAPTRIASPTDKASVEVGVKLIQERLRLLPRERMKYIDLPVERRVPPSYHIPVDNVNYSVPSNLVGKKVVVRKSPDTVEIRHDGLPVAIHRRSFQRDQFVTIESHRSENHLAFVKITFNDWKKDLPDPVRALITIEYKSKRPGRERFMRRYKSIERQFGRDRLIKACETALKNKSPNLTHVTNLLRNKMESGNERPGDSEVDRFNPQRNVRGSDYFDRDIDDQGEAA